MNRIILTRIVFGAYLILFIYKFINGTLIFQQEVPPPLYFPKLNITYWLFLASGIKDAVFNNVFLRYLIDFSVFISALLAVVFPQKVIFPRIFTLFVWLYQFLYFSIVAYQPFAIGILFPCIPFIFKKEDYFIMSFYFGRYFLCGLYFFAGVLKIYNKGIFNFQQMSNSFKVTVNDFLYYNPDSIRSSIMRFFIVNETFAYILYFLAVVLELLFIIGFFTYKFDLFLVVLFLGFHVVNYLILDLPFFNHLIIILFFIPIMQNNSKFKDLLHYRS